jgi:transposase
MAIANPRTVKGFAIALGKAKTDKLDAEVIARFAQSVPLQPQVLPEATVQQLSEQIARWMGVTPMNHDSGKHQGKRMIAGGRTRVSCGLYMSTLVATRHNPVIRDFYQRLLSKGKLKQVALVACMRKLLVILNAMIRDNKLWQEPV